MSSPLVSDASIAASDGRLKVTSPDKTIRISVISPSTSNSGPMNPTSSMRSRSSVSSGLRTSFVPSSVHVPLSVMYGENVRVYVPSAWKTKVYPVSPIKLGSVAPSKYEWFEGTLVSSYSDLDHVPTIAG